MVSIPEGLRPPFDDEKGIGQFDLECEELWEALIVEYFDMGEFAARTHGSHGTYQDGCTGPACLQYHRIYTRGVRSGGASTYWQVFESVLSYLKGALEEEIERSEREAREALRMSLLGQYNLPRALQNMS